MSIYQQNILSELFFNPPCYEDNSRVALFCFFNAPDFPVFCYLFNILCLFPVIFDVCSKTCSLISFICLFSSIKYEMLLCVLHFPQSLLHRISRCFFFLWKTPFYWYALFSRISSKRQRRIFIFQTYTNANYVTSSWLCFICG